MRQIGPADCESIAAMIRVAFATLPVQPPPSALRVTAEDIRAHLARGGGGVVEPALGCLLWAEEADALHVSRVAVDPAHRGHGLAVAMLTAAEHEARRRGLPALRLSTRLAAEGNRRLFARFGFVEGASRCHPGLDHPTIVDLEKPLVNPAPPDASPP